MCLRWHYKRPPLDECARTTTSPFILSKHTKSQGEAKRESLLLIPTSCLNKQTAPGLAGRLSIHQEEIFNLTDRMEGSIREPRGVQILNWQHKPPNYRHGPKGAVTGTSVVGHPNDLGRYFLLIFS